MKHDEIYMKRCLDLAVNGIGLTAPNPMVGSVIVCNDKIIGEGYHHSYGGNHAEVIAINSVKNKSLLPESTLYVNLEPCSHFGKTPPCTDFIIRNKIPKVVIGTIDSNEKVKLQGIKRLQDAGVEVKTGILEDDCRLLNKRFFTFHEKKRPYVILKWAQTLDGFIDKLRNPNKPEPPEWITDEIARKLVHKWRVEEQAILIGRKTAELDNPKLNVRAWTGQNPLRMVIDPHLQLPKTIHLLDKTIPTLVFNSVKSEKNDNLELVKLPFQSVIHEIYDELYKREIISLIVEGGTILLNSIIDSGLWDEARIFTGNKYFRSGVAAPGITGELIENVNISGNSLVILKNS